MDEQATQTRQLIAERVHRLVREYAQCLPPPGPVPEALSLRKDLEIESLSLVSLALRLGEEFNVDIVELELDLGALETVGDLINVGLQLHARSAAEGTR